MIQTKALQPVFDAALRQKRRIVLAEGTDGRVVEGALRAAQDGLADITLIGDKATVAGLCADHPSTPVTIIDPNDNPMHAGLAALFLELRQHKGATPEKADLAARDPLTLANLLVRAGHADGSVAGAVATTADTVRSALQVIGVAPDAKQVSSFFMMLLDAPHHPRKGIIVFADCALVVDPDAAGLADIALASARSITALTGAEPHVAMLSFSTAGSAKHPAALKVSEATQIAKATNPTLSISGEIQFDAALLPDIGAVKAPGFETAGKANIFVFPNLDAGNIGYKIAQRIGGAAAIGPVLQGLAKPANDLSRGCNADDVYSMIAVTAAQANGAQ